MSLFSLKFAFSPSPASAGVVFPAPGFGSASVTTSHVTQSAAATSSYTETTAVDTAKDVSAAVPGDYIFTNDSYWAVVQSRVAGVGGIVTVDKWRHADDRLNGGKPVSGTSQFTIHSACSLAGFRDVRIEAVQILAATAADVVALTNAAGLATGQFRLFDFTFPANPQLTSFTFGPEHGLQSFGPFGINWTTTAAANGSKILVSYVGVK